jgi:hypothetical protein
MKSLAIAFGVRFFRVMSSLGGAFIDNVTGNILTRSHLAPKCSVEPGRKVRNRPVSTKRVRAAMESETNLRRGWRNAGGTEGIGNQRADCGFRRYREPFGRHPRVPKGTIKYCPNSALAPAYISFPELALHASTVSRSRSRALLGTVGQYFIEYVTAISGAEDDPLQ